MDSTFSLKGTREKNVLNIHEKMCYHFPGILFFLKESLKGLLVGSHLFGPRGLHLLHLVGLHLGLHLLPVLAHGALLWSDPGGLLVGLPYSGDLAGGQLGRRRLHSLT